MISIRPEGDWSDILRDTCAVVRERDLCVEINERAEGLTGRFIYNSDLFEQETIQRMIRHWRMVLQEMVASPS